MDTPDRIQYFPKDLCTPLTKESAYLYYLAESLDKEPFNAFAKRLSFANITDEDIITQLKNRINSIASVSWLSCLWKYIEDTRDIYPSSLVRHITKILPEYKVNTYDMCGPNCPKLDNIIVWEMNNISPELTGYFFENLLAHVLNKNVEKDTSKILRRKDSLITIEQFNRMVKRRWKDTDELFPKVLYEAVISYLEKNDLIEDISDAISGLLDYIYKNNDELNEYYENLKESSIVGQMKREINLRYSVYIESEKLGIHGEMDFCSNSCITDCKCYKTENFRLWMLQLYLYRTILNDHALRLRIINFNTNKVHEFTIIRSSDD